MPRLALHLPAAALDLWNLLLLAAAVLIALYFRIEAIVSPRAPALVGWVARIAVGVLAWDLLRRLPVLIHLRL